VRYVGAGRRAAVAIRLAGLAATASITPVPSTPYGPTSRISRSEADTLDVVVIDVSFHVVLSGTKRRSSDVPFLQEDMALRGIQATLDGNTHSRRESFFSKMQSIPQRNTEAVWTDWMRCKRSSE
jgi:hypothetical protein